MGRRKYCRDKDRSGDDEDDLSIHPDWSPQSDPSCIKSSDDNDGDIDDGDGRGDGDEINIL